MMRAIFTQSIDSNADFFQRHPHRHIQKECLPALWVCISPVKLTQTLTITVAKARVVPMMATHCWLFLTPPNSGLQRSPATDCPQTLLCLLPPHLSCFSTSSSFTLSSPASANLRSLETKFSHLCPIYVLFLGRMPPCQLLANSGLSLKNLLTTESPIWLSRPGAEYTVPSLCSHVILHTSYHLCTTFIFF